MDKPKKIERFYTENHQFKDGVHELRLLVLKCGLIETFKWSFPTYTFDNKNIVAICKFKSHFGIWFFNGVFLSDPMKILENAQEVKTKAMRHWKFKSLEEIDKTTVREYITEAIENQKKGLHLNLIRKTNDKLILPSKLSSVFKKKYELRNAFQSLTLAKQREYAEYIETAKQEKTKLSRLHKAIPLILEKKGLNDKYR
ncbi:YdeI/OmpD-associated family protein [Maribacter arcticus]|uniref:YdeI/OmpD-associated family protein n=1 Tax=Maribacter arcticus TaxID=561365 RepID=UPI003001A5CB